MNDRFKYLEENLLPRFWDKDNNEMIYPHLDRVNNWIRYEVKMVDKRYSYPLDWMLLAKNRFIEQKPTGLKDKNVKLIFEGDILKLIPHNKNVFVYYFCSEYMVKTNNDGNEYGAYATLKSTKIYKNSWEIVGNIHENPELLEI